MPPAAKFPHDFSDQVDGDEERRPRFSKLHPAQHGSDAEVHEPRIFVEDNNHAHEPFGAGVFSTIGFVKQAQFVADTWNN